MGAKEARRCPSGPADLQCLLGDRSPPQEWGRIQDVVNGHLIGVAEDEWYISVIGMWLFLPLNLVQALLGAMCQSLYVLFTIGDWCIPGSDDVSVYGAVLRGRPLWLAFTWWRSVLAGVLLLLLQGRSRLAMFLWEKAAMSNTGYFFQGAGIWTCAYSQVDAMLRAPQARQAAFACIPACVPDLFAEKLLIFLPNTGAPDSEWAALRQALHQGLLDQGMDYRSRMQKLPELLSASWRDPKLRDLTDGGLMPMLVSKCLFYVLFGEWVNNADAAVLADWRNHAFWFILPRLVQRFLFNIGIDKVKQLRMDTVAIIEKHGKQDIFMRMNRSLPKQYQRANVVQLCDEMMYVIGFAGIGGTSAAIDAVGAFLQVQLPGESPGAEHVDFGRYFTREKMVAKYKENPDRYIRETLRMVPPVTSATSSFAQAAIVPMAGQDVSVPQGVLNQYVLSIANRDEAVFPDSKVFEPDRANLEQALTWNGAFGSKDEGSYPRICPGRHLSMDVIKALVNEALKEKPQRERGCLG